MQTSTPTEDRAYSVLEACERLGDISRAHLYELIRTGQLVALKSGSRTIIRQSDLTAYLDSLPQHEQCGADG